MIKAEIKKEITTPNEEIAEQLWKGYSLQGRN